MKRVLRHISISTATALFRLIDTEKIKGRD